MKNKTLEFYAENADIAQANIAHIDREIRSIQFACDIWINTGWCRGIFTPANQRYRLLDSFISIEFPHPYCRLNKFKYRHKLAELQAIRKHLVWISKLNERSNVDLYDLETIKQIPIATILDALNAQKDGKHYICPIHNEKTGSLHIYESTNSFYCFGCHAGGTNIDLVAKTNQCDVASAIRFLSTLQ